ncbi:MAG: hypothetical protein ACMXYD_05205 [Candidatus Woesearchaeota archaeon]
MKQTTILALTLAILLLAATYNEQDTFTFNGYEHNITNIIGDRVLIDTQHGRFILQANNCEVFDTHLWCVDNLTYDPVEYWPHEYEITISRERLCDTCKTYGQTCEVNLDCADYCVHGTCRPTRTWCGDGICDIRENCPEDCKTEEEIVSNQTSTETETNEIITNETLTNQTQQEEIEVVEEETTPTTPPAQDEPNWLAGGLIIFGGLFTILLLFGRKKKTKDLYSYRK